MLALRVEAAWRAIKWSLVTLYNDVYDEHLFVFAAGLSYYFVLSLFPLLVSMASMRCAFVMIWLSAACPPPPVFFFVPQC